MSATLLGERLEQAFVNHNDRFRHVVAANMGYAFLKYYTPNDLDPLVAAIWQLHGRFENYYQNISANFYQAYRQSETGLFDPVQFASGRNTYQSVVTSLMIHGPQAIKRKEGLLNKPFTEFSTFERDQSINNVTRELVYKALEAPRDNMMTTMIEDPETARWVRRADKSACKFCKMLVSRGAVYLKNTSRFQAHSNCGCSAVPVYKGYKMPDDVALDAQRWLDENKGKETKKRRSDAVEAELKAGLKEKKTIVTVDKFGRESSRDIFVDTDKGKKKKAEESKKLQANLDDLKRDGADYKEPEMTDFQKKDNKAQVEKVLAQLKNPVP